MSIMYGAKPVAGIGESDLKQEDVIDSLDSTATSFPLSANQGRVLDEKIETKIEDIETLIGDVKVGTKGTLQEQVDKKADKSITKSATLLASDWTGDSVPYTIRLTVAEATETNNIEVLPPTNLTTDQRDAMCNADIDGGGQGVGWIELVANDEKPAIDLPVVIIIRGD